MKRISQLLMLLALLAGVFGLYRQFDRSGSLTCGEHLYQSLDSQHSRIFVAGYGMTPDTLAEEWNQTLYGSPELFHVGFRYQYLALGSRVIFVTPEYTLTGDALTNARAEYDSALKEILSTVDPHWSDLETALYLHDYLCMHYAYDDTLTNFTAYQMLTEGSGVCQAYTLLYTALLEACGLDSGCIVSGSMNHTWNTVTLDGQRYHVDVTYDDPTEDRPGRAAHTNFLVSDSALSDTHSFTPEEGLGLCPDSSYDNSLWQTASSGFVPCGDSFYYISKGTIRRWDDANASTAVLTIFATWFTDRGDGSYWEGNYSVLWADGDRLLYNTPDRIMALNPVTGRTQTIYTHTGSGSIYGFAYTDGLLTLQLSDSPNEAGELVKIELA